MKSSRLTLSAFLLVSGTIACRAALGDTEAQCIAKYGPEFDVRDSVGYRQVGDRAASFHYKTATGSFDIRIVFLNGTSCHETYNNGDSSKELSLEQMKGILETQRGRFEWREGRTIYRTGNIAGATSGRTDWTRSDGGTAKFWITVNAKSQAATGSVEISTRQYTEAQRVYDKENGE